MNFAKFAKPGDANPVTFNRLDNELLHEMRETNALFGRKFSEGSCSTKLWEQLIYDNSVRSNQSLQEGNLQLELQGHRKGEKIKLETTGSEHGETLGLKRRQQQAMDEKRKSRRDDAHKFDGTDIPLYDDKSEQNTSPRRVSSDMSKRNESLEERP